MKNTFIEIDAPHSKQVAVVAAEIWRQYYTPLLGEAQVEYMLSAFQSEKAICDSILTGTRYFLIECEKQIAGYFAYSCEKDAIFLSKLYLKAEYRKKGLSREVIEYLKGVKQELQKSKLYLTVNKQNAPSIAAYRALGFEISSSVNTDIGSGFFMDDYIMQL